MCFGIDARLRFPPPHTQQLSGGSAPHRIKQSLDKFAWHWQPLLRIDILEVHLVLPPLSHTTPSHPGFAPLRTVPQKLRSSGR